MSKTRPIAEIEHELKEACERLEYLQKELQAARLARFLQDSGVPAGARPVFSNGKGQRVLVEGFDGPYFPIGRFVKKDGSVSDGVRRRLYLGDGYKFIGE